MEGPASRRRLAELFWPAATDARDSLGTTLRRLQALGSDTIIIEGDGVAAGVACDAVDFAAAVAGGRNADAALLYVGPFVDGIDLPLQEEVEDWLYATRERLADHARRAHLRLASAALDAGEADDAMHHAERALGTAHTSGDDARSLAALVGLLRRAGSPLARDAEREALGLGIVLERAEVGAGVARPDATVPHVATTFVGRREELAAIAAAFQTPHARLLTLHGPGGAGKSRLAIEAARRFAGEGRFPEGVYFVPLETVTEPAAVTEAISGAMRLLIPPLGSPEQHVINSIGSRELLLVLDNVEHLVGHTTLPALILRECPHVRILVTSRMALGLNEEHVIAVEGLPLEGPAGEGEALELLADRMKQHGSSTRMSAEDELAAARVCRVLDGSPLAIELAAALTRALPLSDVLAEIERDLEVLVNRDATAPTRHRSLAAALDVSWDLLDEHDQRALAWLAPFSGGFRRSAARSVAGVDAGALARLVDASLVRVLTNGRFERHPIVHQYGGLKLSKHPQDERTVRDRHARYFLRRVGSQDHELLGPAATHTAAWIDEEFANIQSAWAWHLHQGQTDGLVDVAWSLVHFGEMRGRYADVSALFTHGIEALSERTDEAARIAMGSFQGCLAFLSFRLGHYEAAIAAGASALRVLTPVDRPDAAWGAWAAGQGIGLTHMALGQLEAARAPIRANLDLCTAQLRAETDERRRRALEVMAGSSHEALGVIAIQAGAFEDALAHVNEAMRLLRPHAAYGLGYVYWSLGQAHLGVGDVAEAKVWLDEGLHVAHESGFENLVGYLLDELARVHLAFGDTNRADVTFRRALELALTNGDAMLEARVRSGYGRAALADARNPEARDRLRAAASVARRHGCYPFAMEAIEGLADLDVREGRITEGVRAFAFLRSSPFTAPAMARSAQEKLELLRERIGEEHFSDACRRGVAIGVDEAFDAAAQEAGQLALGSGVRGVPD